MPPYSDNLYSAEDESDGGESFSNELSPTDGYFHRGSQVPDRTVRDPTIPPSDTAEAKAQEARNELQANVENKSRRVAPPPTHSGHSHSHSSTSAPPGPSRSPYATPPSHHFDVARQPPPAYTYTAPIASSPTSPLSPQPTNYSTFSLPTRPEEAQPSRDPESMGGQISLPGEPSGERTPLWRDHDVSPRRAIVRKVLALALVVAIVSSLTAIMVSFVKSHGDPRFNDPSKGHSGPPFSRPPFNDPSDPNRRYCSATFDRNRQIYDIPANNALTIRQKTQDNREGSNARHVNTSGAINIRRIPKDAKASSKGYFTIDVSASEPELAVWQTWDDETGRLEISTPRYAPYTGTGHPCIVLDITAWLPEDAAISELLVEAVTLHLQVYEDAKIKVSGESRFSTVSGHIVFVGDGKSNPSSQPPPLPLDGRHITVTTVSGSINGFYPLYDLLHLETISGTITATVTPQEILSSAPAPAELRVLTKSGTINVYLPTRDTPPPRDYITSVETISSTVNGQYYLGLSARFQTKSGTIAIEVLPAFLGEDEEGGNRKFSTDTISGTTKVKVLEPIFFPKAIGEGKRPGEVYIPIGDSDPYLLQKKQNEAATASLRSLKSSHTVKSATIDVEYPEAWEGHIYADSISGTIDLRGHAVEIIKQEGGWGHKQVVARRGVKEIDEGSRVDLGSISGTIKLRAL